MKKPSNDCVTVIGAANIDINGFSTDPVNIGDSNPGRVEYCPGGVGRNIAENLLRLGTEVHLVSVIGDDPGGDLIRSSCKKTGLDIEHSLFLRDTASSVYMAIMDSTGEMKLALSDMSVLERMTKEHLESKAELIAGSRIIVLDAGLTAEIMLFVLDRFGAGESPPLIFLDPVSARKSAKLKSFAGRFHTLKLNRMEAEYLSGISLSVGERNTENSAKPPAGPSPALEKALEKAGSYFVDQGTRQVFITLGKGGIYFASAEDRFFTPVNYVRPVNTSGGGDAFMAGMVYGTLRGWAARRIVPFSAAMAAITVQSGSTSAQNMSLELAEKTMAAAGQPFGGTAD